MFFFLSILYLGLLVRFLWLVLSSLSIELRNESWNSDGQQFH
jgi:hypothetical protein